MRGIVAVAGVWLGVASGSAWADVTTAVFHGQHRWVTPYGYGTVNQQLIASGSQTGQAWCASLFGANQQCLSVSGGNACSAVVPVGEVVSCNAAGTPAVDETPFQPVDCQGQGVGPIGPLGSQEWCAFADLEPTRTADTIYLYSDWLRVGVNRRFGGTIFELYGADKTNRLLQNGGGAMQLSLWGDDANYAPVGSTIAAFEVGESLPPHCDATAYNPVVKTTDGPMPACPPDAPNGCTIGLVGPNVSDCSAQFACADNGLAAGGPVNPIQAISAGCQYGQSAYSNNEAAVTSVTATGPGNVTVSKTGPQQYTKSTNENIAGLAWSQTVSLVGPFAKITYHVTYSGTQAFNIDFQELPALFTHQGMTGASVYYFASSRPGRAYQNARSNVTVATTNDTQNEVYQLPGRSGPFGVGLPPGHGEILQEDWASLCDVTQTRCLTVASFDDPAKVIIYGPGDYAYFGIHGFFALTPGLDLTFTVYVAPYRYDDVVAGQTVRQWVYQLKGAS